LLLPDDEKPPLLVCGEVMLRMKELPVLAWDRPNVNIAETTGEI
jgi:hypothetical protein